MLLAALAVAALHAPSPISSYHGTLAYSRYTNGRYSLELRTGAREVTARVASRSTPFDVDLGPDGNGRTVAVYSRCSSAPSDEAGAMLYQGVSGCQVYLYDPVAQRERPIAGATGYLPAIWRNTVAFARGTGLVARVNGRLVAVDDGTPDTGVAFTGIDLEGTTIAAAREYDAGYDALATQMVVTGIGRRAKVIEQRRNGISFRAMRFPTLSGGRLYYAEVCAGDPASCFQEVRRYTVSSGALAKARSRSMSMTGFTQDGATAYFVRPRAYAVESFRPRYR